MSDYDAVHLGAGAARLADVGDDLYGWDCECTWCCRWPHGARIRRATLPAHAEADAHVIVGSTDPVRFGE